MSSQLGSRERWRTIGGHTVSALVYEVAADLPVYDIEVVNSAGEVVEYHERVVGWTALSLLAQRRGWVAL